VLDLSRVTFLDSSGLCVLIEVAAASDVHGTLHLVGVFGNDPVERVLRMTGRRRRACSAWETERRV
jgi:anti-anti-sigma factor